jgi:hypothetical protein
MPHHDDPSPIRTEPDLSGFLSSLERLSARLLEAILRSSQIASSSTPEMRELFDRWTDCLCEDILETIEREGAIDIGPASARIGVSESTLLGLLLALNRRGRIRIGRIEGQAIVHADDKTAPNAEICDCLR